MAFEEAAHPRGKTGSPTGGEFVASTGPGATGKSVLGLKAKAASLPSGGGKGKGKGKKGGKGGKGKGTPAAVKGVQTLLNKLGFKDAAGKPLAVDGIVGPKTSAAIRAAQRKYGLPTTGKLTPALLKRLKAPRMAKAQLGTGRKPSAFGSPAQAGGSRRSPASLPPRARPTPRVSLPPSAGRNSASAPSGQ